MCKGLEVKKGVGQTSGCGLSKCGQSDQYEEAAIELELEVDRGCCCSCLHQGKARQGARCLSVLSSQHGMEISTAALQGRVFDCQPVPPRARAQSESYPMERIEAAREAHCSLPYKHPRFAVTPPSTLVDLETVMPRPESRVVDCFWREFGNFHTHTSLGHDHKPCASSTRQFHQAEGVMAASSVSPVNISNVLFFFSFSFSKSPNPSSRF